MFLALDVDYRDNVANGAGIVFDDILEDKSISEYTIKIDKINDYVPGQFFKRELPCLVEVIKIVKEEITTIIIDGYVWLSDNGKPGLGAHLYDEMDRKIPVIGVAKHHFHSNGNNCRIVCRGESRNGLFITSAGIDNDIAAEMIQKMAGEYRMPTLLKRVDTLCRNW
jgi:deoxyinosine 3'endonuclease (endonuclease V)